MRLTKAGASGILFKETGPDWRNSDEVPGRSLEIVARAKRKCIEVHFQCHGKHRQAACVGFGYSPAVGVHFYSQHAWQARYEGRVDSDLQRAMGWTTYSFTPMDAEERHHCKKAISAMHAKHQHKPRAEYHFVGTEYDYPSNPSDSGFFVRGSAYTERDGFQEFREEKIPLLWGDKVWVRVNLDTNGEFSWTAGDANEEIKTHPHHRTNLVRAELGGNGKQIVWECYHLTTGTDVAPSKADSVPELLNYLTPASRSEEVGAGSKDMSASSVADAKSKLLKAALAVAAANAASEGSPDDPENAMC